MSYLSQQFKIKLNLDFHRQFEAVYGCNIEIMKKILSLKIYEIISLFKSNQKDKTISYLSNILEKISELDENFEFFMNCTYEQLLDYYFNYSEKNEKQKENNNNINDIDNYFSSFF